VSGAGPHGPLVFGIEDPSTGDVTGLTSADASIDIQDPGGPVPDLSVRRRYGAKALGPGSMGNLPIATWIQVPLPINAPANNVAQVGNTLVILEAAAYLVGWGGAFDYIKDAGSTVLRAAMTIGGDPSGAGVPIVGTLAIHDLTSASRVATLSRTSLLDLSPAQVIGLWVFIDTGIAPMPATSIDFDMFVSQSA
jgi:hypothetical protein